MKYAVGSRIRVAPDLSATLPQRELAHISLSLARKSAKFTKTVEKATFRY